MRADHVFESFIKTTGIDAEAEVLPTNFECLKTVVDAHDKECGKFDDYSLKYAKNIVQACEHGSHTTESLVAIMKTSCRI